MRRQGTGLTSVLLVAPLDDAPDLKLARDGHRVRVVADAAVEGLRGESAGIGVSASGEGGDEGGRAELGRARREWADLVDLDQRRQVLVSLEADDRRVLARGIAFWCVLHALGRRVGCGGCELGLGIRGLSRLLSLSRLSLQPAGNADVVLIPDPHPPTPPLQPPMSPSPTARTALLPASTSSATYGAADVPSKLADIEQCPPPPPEAASDDPSEHKPPGSPSYGAAEVKNRPFREIALLCLGGWTAVFCAALSASVTANLASDIASSFKAGHLASWCVPWRRS